MNEEQLARIEKALSDGPIGAEAVTELIEFLSLISNWGVDVPEVVEAIKRQHFISWARAMEYASAQELPVVNYRYGRIYPE